MNPIKKIAGINLLVLLVYSLFIRIASSGSGHNEEDLGIIIFSAMFVGLHVLVCFVISLRNFAWNNRKLGRAWLLSAGIVLLVGFSVCLGNAAL
jgi:hypothetical protein